MLYSCKFKQKIIFHKYYNYNIYTLTDKIDKYIRNNYYGGRVEFFYKPSVEINTKLYYYDFTSLYPAMCQKLLPCGLPKYMDGCDIVINIDNCNFFGFVRCLVKTKNKNIKPLHAIRHDNKLIFPYFDNKT